MRDDELTQEPEATGDDEQRPGQNQATSQTTPDGRPGGGQGPPGRAEAARPRVAFARHPAEVGLNGAPCYPARPRAISSAG